MNRELINLDSLDKAVEDGIRAFNETNEACLYFLFEGLHPESTGPILNFGAGTKACAFENLWSTDAGGPKRAHFGFLGPLGETRHVFHNPLLETILLGLLKANFRTEDEQLIAVGALMSTFSTWSSKVYLASDEHSRLSQPGYEEFLCKYAKDLIR